MSNSKLSLNSLFHFFPSDLNCQSETSDYGSNTDLEQQSPILINNDSRSSFLFSIIDHNNHTLQNHREPSLSSSTSNLSSSKSILCSYEKRNFFSRKRYRRYFKNISYENYQNKRTKTNIRSRTCKENRNNSYVQFSIDLTGQNINYTIEYHYNTTIYYDSYYISWLPMYYYYYYYHLYFYHLQSFERECERKLMTISCYLL